LFLRHQRLQSPNVLENQMLSLGIPFFLRTFMARAIFGVSIISLVAAFHFPVQNYSSVPVIYQPAKKQTTVMKAWSCHGRNQQEMVFRLKQAGIIRSDEVYRVMSLVDRQNYFPTWAGTSAAYQDSPSSIGCGQTISAPHMHAYVLEEVASHLRKHRESNSGVLKFLDVGCGSGYVTACFGRWLQNKPSLTNAPSNLGRYGYVHGMDIFPELVQLSKANIMKDDADLLQPRFPDKPATVTLHVGNGWDGIPLAGPFDIIHVGAAAKSIPYTLCQQLNQGGLLIVPIGPSAGAQVLYKIERLLPEKPSDPADPTDRAAHTDHTKTNVGFDRNEFRMTELLGVRYVPLIEKLPS
jgi:protein-L-isoaspartate(D-aspartate) O-methyltransferase